MSKAHRDLARMEKAAVEVDGEFCVPQEIDEVRYHLDLGPIFGDVQRPAHAFRRALLFLPALFLFILAIQLMKAGAAAVGPTIEGSFPSRTRHRRSARMARRLPGAVGIPGRRDHDEPLRRAARSRGSRR